MKLKKIIKELDVVLQTDIDISNIEVETGYVGDLLSDVLANGEENAIWFTVQKHQNILAVADAKEISAIVIVNGVKPAENLIEKANSKNIPVFTTKNSSFIESGKLFKLLK